MKPKHIRLTLKRKLDAWVASIESEELREAIKIDALVTGGAIASMLLGEKPNDYDVYFRTQETAAKVAQYYVAKFLENPPPRFKGGGTLQIGVLQADDRVKIVVGSAGIAGGQPDQVDGPVEQVMMTRDADGNVGYEYFEGNPDDDASEEYVEGVQKAADTAADESKDKPPYRPVFLSSNAITLSDGIQIVIRFTGEVAEIHENYDYVHCTCSYQYSDGKLVTPEKALVSLLNKDLHYIGSRYPLCSLIRMRKFLRREWKITAGQIVKMCWDVAQLDLNNPEVLQEQLIGVDAAYFAEVLRILQEDRAAGKVGADIDRSYLMSVIDRVF